MLASRCTLSSGSGLPELLRYHPASIHLDEALPLFKAAFTQLWIHGYLRTTGCMGT